MVKRNPELGRSEGVEIAHQIAVGALRYFLLKFTRTQIIAFDFRGSELRWKTGLTCSTLPCAYNNIMNKLREADPNFDFGRVQQFLNDRN